MGGSLNLPEHKKALFHSELQMTLDNLHWAGGWTGRFSEASNLNYSVITPTWLTLGSQKGNVPPEVPFLITSGFGCCKASLSRKLFSSPEDISSMHHTLWCTFMPHVPPLTFQVPKQFQRWGTHLTRIHFFLSLRSPGILLWTVSGSANHHPVDLSHNLFHGYFNFRKILTPINMPRVAIWIFSASFTNEWCNELI